MYKEVIKWLRIQQMPVAESHLRLRLESHPDYPSLIAVQDTLSELNIESYAYRTNKEEVIKAGKPFLAHINSGEGHILAFPDMATAQQKVKDFTKHWDGVVMLAEKCGKYGSAEHDRQYKLEKQNKIFKAAVISIIVSALAGLAIYYNSTESLLLILSIAGGLYFSWLIAQKEFGIQNSVSDKICRMAKHNRCESVLFSKGAKLFNWLTWGDVGMVYFNTSLLFLLVALVTHQPASLQFYYLLSLGGLLFPVYSLFYQWKVVKQWCMLCIAVLAALFLNALTAIIYFQWPVVFNESSIYGALVFSVLATIILSAWQVLKMLYQKSLFSLANEIKATRLKRNPEIFNALLQQETASPINLPEPDEAIFFGNPAAQYQLVIACNPYCGPCAKAHQAIEQLYERYPDKLSVAVRFALSSSKDKDSRTLAAKEILKAAKQKPYEAIKDWYHLFSLDEFKKAHPTNGLDESNEFEKHIQWSKAEEIVATPTFFVNGRRLPKIFTWLDFVEVVEYEMK